ncbi:MAG: hypothetical protein KatS3mg096_583 [Candidatus Parcubacteria bacterium]|nr:MAG: hypothetical protein KatS3mg096_583 [Candidatus Parcubacteria bacterium]
MSKSSGISLGIAIGLTGLGITALREYRQLQDFEFEILLAKIKKIDLNEKKAYIYLKVKFKSKNLFNIYVKKHEYNIYVENKYIGKLYDINDSIKVIKPFRTNIIELEGEIDLRNLSTSLIDLIKKLNIELKQSNQEAIKNSTIFQIEFLYSVKYIGIPLNLKFMVDFYLSDLIE